ncbi:hypothetical protein CHS0354_006868 [Potamilus streckersoni]|uniref:Aminopeptidase P N-terminal domain-containing protein n=1 Tax=Potamilus streckersoni TaxID=2493646 RepID=A0AAE0TEC0_9BIVA|nr:hypothetical protein CHS0354_006868 [Potamilus streckersoni]
MRKTVPPFSASVYMTRRKTLLDALEDNSVLLLYSGESFVKSLDALYPFVVDADFFYLTGIEEEDVRYIAVKKAGAVKEFLFIADTDAEKERWDGTMLTVQRAKDISGIEYVFSRTVLKNSFIARFPLPYFQRYLSELAQLFPGTVMKKITGRINSMRLKKDEGELERIVAATGIIAEAFKQVLPFIRPEQYEYEAEAVITSVYHRHGCPNGFDMIIGSGRNSTVLHYNDNNCRMQNGMLVLIDTGVSYGGYNADITRTLPVNGKYTARQRQLYTAVLDMQREYISKVRAGMTSEQVFELAGQIQGKIVIREGLTDNEKEHTRFTVHRIGHPIGLDVHDPVDPHEPLPAGAVLTVEPGIYLPEEEIGIRIEDMILLTDSGCRVLSDAIPKNPDEIEALMAKHGQCKYELMDHEMLWERYEKGTLKEGCRLFKLDREIKVSFEHFDGTLYDTSVDIAHTVNAVRDEYGLAALPLPGILAHVGNGVENLLRACLSEVPDSLDTLADKFRTAYLDNTAEATCSYPGVEEFLNSDTHIKIILSNKTEAVIRRILDIKGTTGFFRRVIGGDTFTCRKPDPELLDIIRRDFPFEVSQFLMVGDDMPDILFAERAGIDMVYCNFGFRGDLHAPGRVSIDNYYQLAELLAVR